MKLYYTKKSICAALVLALLLGFSLCNLAFGGEVLQELGEDFGKIRSLADLKDWITEAEDELNDELLLHNWFIENHSAIQKQLGKQEVNNFGVIRDADGMLYYGSTYNMPNTEVPYYVEQTAQLRDLVESNGGKFLVMLPPSKVLYGVSKVDLSLPLNNPNAKMDKLLSMLQQRRVDALDLRLTMQRSGEPLDRLFFKTDHHWTPLAAFYAMQDLVGHLNDKYGANLDPDGYYRDLNNYEIDVYPELMLGSNGRNVGKPFSGLDDFTYIWLRDYKDTEFTWYNYSDDEEVHGDLKGSLLQEKKLVVKSYYHGDPYGVYMATVNEHDRIVNHQNPSGPKIAVLRDSYFSPVACFMAPMCSQIDMYWNQRAEYVDEFIEQIQKEDYDYVILEIYPYNLNTEAFTFFEEVVG